MEKRDRSEYDPSEYAELLESSKELISSVSEIQKKITGSPVLNGGFDRLCEQVKRIEDSQITANSKIDELHDAMYHPEEGLYIRIRDLNSWKSLTEKQELEETKKKQELDSTLADIKTLMAWKKTVAKLFFLIITPLAGFLLRDVYVFVMTHVALK